MSSVISNVLCGSLDELMPSKTLCARSARRVFVECSGLKPCCRMRRSMTLEGVQRSVIGRYDAGSVGSLFGLGMVMILPCFQMLGMVLCE